jgi:hypothetical protein
VSMMALIWNLPNRIFPCHQKVCNKKGVNFESI